jgi:hypothetical protein
MLEEPSDVKVGGEVEHDGETRLEGSRGKKIGVAKSLPTFKTDRKRPVQRGTNLVL